MQIKPLGKIVVTTAGTPVQVTADPTLVAHRVLVSPVTGSKTVYLGVAGMVKATGAGVIREVLQPAATGIGDCYELTCETGSNVFRASDLYLDGTQNNDSAYVTLFIL